MRWTSETKPKGGRKPGSRNKLCRAVLEDLMADWAEGGAAAIKMMRVERPAEYVRVMCSILPKELIFESGMSDFDDDALDELLAGLHQRLLEVREQQALLAAPTVVTKLSDISLPPEQIEAAIARIKAEKERRLAEKIEVGEIVSVPLFIVAGSESVARAQVEQTKTDKLAELRAGGETREVVFDVTIVVTGVRRPGEAAETKPWKPMSPPSLPTRLPTAKQSAVDLLDEVAEAIPEEPPPPIIETYVQVQVRQCLDDDDPGEVAEGWFSTDGKFVTVTDSKGREIGSRAMLEGEDARVVAKQLLREKVPESEIFNRRLIYPSVGLA